MRIRRYRDRYVQYPSFNSAIVLLALFWICQLISGVFVELLSSAFGGVHSGAAWGMINTLAFYGVMQFVIRKPGMTIGAIVGRTRVPMVAFLAIAIGCVGALVLITELEAVVLKLLPMSGRIRELFEMLDRPENLFGAILLLCLVAPITEEILFRGVILAGFLKNYRRTDALLLPSCLFAFAHLNPWQYIGAFLLGLLLGYAYMRTQSIIPSMLLHGLYNGLTLATDSVWNSILSLRLPLPLLLVGIVGTAFVVAAVLLLMYSPKLKRFEKHELAF